jgi:dGTP triphosphohydrolase
METLDRELHLRGNEAMLDILEPIYEKVEKIAKPKAIYFKAVITEKTADRVKINGVSFESELFRGYVNPGDTVFPYIVTVGTELDDYAKTLKDSMDLFMIDEVMNLLVNTGKVFVADAVKTETDWLEVQDYVPGNGEEWSTAEQKRLFDMFEGETEKIGVTLGDNYFVLPGRSTIGILSKKG